MNGRGTSAPAPRPLAPADRGPPLTMFVHNAREFRCAACDAVFRHFGELASHRRRAHRAVVFDDWFQSSCACAALFRRRVDAMVHSDRCTATAEAPATTSTARLPNKKLEKYAVIKEYLEFKGYTVTLSALIYGSLGSVAQRNYKVYTEELGMRKGVTRALERQLSARNINFSHRIWKRHALADSKLQLVRTAVRPRTVTTAPGPRDDQDNGSPHSGPNQDDGGGQRPSQRRDEPAPQQKPARNRRRQEDQQQEQRQPDQEPDRRQPTTQMTRPRDPTGPTRRVTMTTTTTRTTKTTSPPTDNSTRVADHTRATATATPTTGATTKTNQRRGDSTTRDARASRAQTKTPTTSPPKDTTRTTTSPAPSNRSATPRPQARKATDKTTKTKTKTQPKSSKPATPKNPTTTTRTKPTTTPTRTSKTGDARTAAAAAAREHAVPLGRHNAPPRARAPQGRTQQKGPERRYVPVATREKR